MKECLSETIVYGNEKTAGFLSDMNKIDSNAFKPEVVAGMRTNKIKMCGDEIFFTGI